MSKVEIGDFFLNPDTNEVFCVVNIYTEGIMRGECTLKHVQDIIGYFTYVSGEKLLVDYIKVVPIFLKL